MKVFIFGNENLDFDSNALSVVNKIGEGLAEVEFIIVKPNEDLPFDNGEDVVMMAWAASLISIPRHRKIAHKILLQVMVHLALVMLRCPKILLLTLIIERILFAAILFITVMS